MFAEKIPPFNENEKIFKSRRETVYARINWTHHLKPLVKEVYIEFYKDLVFKGYNTPHLICLSDSIEKGEKIEAEKDVYSDTISINYGPTPVPVRPIFAKKEGFKILAEDGASLVFSTGINGGVLAFIYPQKTEVSRTKQKYYIIGEWRNSAEITRSDIRKMLRFLFEIQMYCGIFYSGKLSARILTKLSAKDSSIRDGSNPLLRHVKYFMHLVKGMRKLYGMGSPTP